MSGKSEKSSLTRPRCAGFCSGGGATGAGAAKADIDAARGIRAASKEFPRAWIERANRARLTAQHFPPGAGYRGDYIRPQAADSIIQTPGRPNYKLAKGRGMIRTDSTPDNAVHEYTHHLQETMPELDGLFRRFHVRRTTRPDGTTRDPIAPLPGYPGAQGREDRYVDAYFGAEYPGPAWPSGPMEAITRTYQLVFGEMGQYPKMTVRTLRHRDPEILDFAIGLLFRYDPS